MFWIDHGPCETEFKLLKDVSLFRSSEPGRVGSQSNRVRIEGMKIGDKVVYRSAFWLGPPTERRRLVFKVVEVEPEKATNALRVSVMAGNGQLMRDVEGERFEVVGPAPLPPACP